MAPKATVDFKPLPLITLFTKQETLPMRCRILALMGLFLGAASASQAQNLVVNPGFETGDTTGWVVTGSNYSIDSGVGHTGLCAAAFGALAPDVDDVSQMLATAKRTAIHPDLFCADAGI